MSATSGCDFFLDFEADEIFRIHGGIAFGAEDMPFPIGPDGGRGDFFIQGGEDRGGRCSRDSSFCSRQFFLPKSHRLDTVQGSQKLFIKAAL